jgi:putative membrane protein
MRQQLGVFLVRWLLNTVGIWIAILIFGTGYDRDLLTVGMGGFLLAGLIFSLVNAILRPIVIILSLPAILLSLGLFTFVVNGLMVYISLALAPNIQTTFLNAIIIGIVLSLINYVVSSIFQIDYQKRTKEAL